MIRLLVSAGMLFVSLVVSAQETPPYTVTPIAGPLNKPWTAVELPDSRWIITERDGHVVVADDDSLTRYRVPLPGLYVDGQGGLLDLALTQDFTLSGKVMLTYVKGTADANTMVIANADMAPTGQLKNITPVLEVTPTRATPVHYGGRLAVLNDGTWLVTSGDGFDYREQAQVMSSQFGKILRFQENGTAPSDNPFPDAPYVYTLGHRNPQALVVDEQSETIFAHEHGPAGGDEINQIVAGNNYGWPVATLGLDYSGAKISPFSAYPGMTAPLVNWTPSVAPSGMVRYTGSLFPSLQGSLLVTTLKAKQLLHVDLTKETPQIQPIFATLNQRLRDVTQSRAGAVVVLTDGDNAQLLEIVPAQ
ncbi:PQQ-dependent sugar dehydrogenase [Alteromonas sp. CYL-A6]|uniref:PQQ-dependent sugar dehydrogenase n=1 Tax=Alteromonas nitratireducens TaxID=3390813 RepID=UPI0034B8C5EC